MRFLDFIWNGKIITPLDYKLCAQNVMPTASTKKVIQRKTLKMLR